jgi:hypothetical protein
VQDKQLPGSFSSACDSIVLPFPGKLIVSENRGFKFSIPQQNEAKAEHLPSGLRSDDNYAILSTKNG